MREGLAPPAKLTPPPKWLAGEDVDEVTYTPDGLMVSPVRLMVAVETRNAPPPKPGFWRKWGGEIFWGLWVVLGIAFELFAVFTEKRTGQEPLTRLLRDRLMARPGVVGWTVRLGTMTFIGYLTFHFFTPLEW